MIDNLIVSLQAVFPLFAIMAVGFAIRRVGLVDEYSLKKMNSVCFKVFMACMMFNNIYKIDLWEFAGKALKYYVIFTVSYCVLVYIAFTVRYSKAKKSLKHYFNTLKLLGRIYAEEEENDEEGSETDTEE